MNTAKILITLSITSLFLVFTVTTIKLIYPDNNKNDSYKSSDHIQIQENDGRVWHISNRVISENDIQGLLNTSEYTFTKDSVTVIHYSVNKNEFTNK
jgi:hypothetical protein